MPQFAAARWGPDLSRIAYIRLRERFDGRPRLDVSACMSVEGAIASRDYAQLNARVSLVRGFFLCLAAAVGGATVLGSSGPNNGSPGLAALSRA